MTCPHNAAAVCLGRVDPGSTARGGNGGDNCSTGGTGGTDTSNSATVGRPGATFSHTDRHQRCDQRHCGLVTCVGVCAAGVTADSIIPGDVTFVVDSGCSSVYVVSAYT